MEKDFKLLFIYLFVSALFAGSNAVAGNWNSSSNGTTAKVDGSINLFVPDDVIRLFNSASPQEKIKHCGANSDFAYKEIERLSSKPPKRIFGYNSRMDNGEKVEGAMETDAFVLRLAAVYTDSWVSGSNEKRQKVLDALYAWAKADALTKTKPCVKNGWLLDSCSAWTQNDGQDPSDKKDHSTTQMHMMHMAYGYYLTLADFNSNDPKHKVIQNWIQTFFKWNKKPGGVYIGLDLGYHWPAILQGTLENASGSSERHPKKLLTKAVRELDKIVLEDGSFKDRTTRGNRALWYHHTGLIETFVTLEMARKYGVKIPESLEQRIEKAGEIFIRGFEDHSYMDKWARKAHNSVFTAGKQDFKNNLGLNGNAWFYIFSYRYPNADFTQKLDKMLNLYPGNSHQDGYIGFGLGCIYAVAKDVSEIGNNLNTAALQSSKDPLNKNQSNSVVPFQFSHAYANIIDDKDDFLSFRIKFVKLNGNENEPNVNSLKVMIDFRGKSKRESRQVIALRLEIPSGDYLDPSKAKAVLSCKKSTIKKKGDKLVAYRLYSGNDAENNDCALSTMTEAGREEAESLFATLDQIFADDNVKKSDPYGILNKHSQLLMGAN